MSGAATAIKLLIPDEMLDDYDRRGDLVSMFLRLREYKSRALLTAAGSGPTDIDRALKMMAHADGEPERDPEGDRDMASWIADRRPLREDLTDVFAS